MLQANHQLDGALEFLSALGPEPLDANAFEEASGVGIEVSLRIPYYTWSGRARLCQWLSLN